MYYDYLFSSVLTISKRINHNKPYQYVLFGILRLTTSVPLLVCVTVLICSIKF